MVAKQAAKSTGRKKAKTTAKKKPAGGAAPKKAAVRLPERSKNPAYVLIIMGLVTALALLFGRYYTPQRPVAVKPPVEKPVSEKKEEKRDKEQAGRDSKEDRGSKPEREEKTSKQTVIKEPIEKKEAESVKVYLVALNEKTDKMYLAPVIRKVRREPLLENTLRELVKGPTAAEKRKGLMTAIPPELKINSVKIRNKTAEIDFNSAIEHGAAGSILLNRLDQIVYTATQFSGVGSVIIKINGKTQADAGCRRAVHIRPAPPETVMDILEIEIKSYCDDHAPVAEKLTAMGARPAGCETEQDLYLNHPGRDFKDTDEALRLRRAGERVVLTYKGPKIGTAAKTRLEEEVPVADFDKTLAILKHLGFIEFGTVTKVREHLPSRRYRGMPGHG